MKYYLIVGEASGDLHASHLMHRLKVVDPQAQFRFYGGDKMAAEGGTLVTHYRDLAYMGFVQVVRHLPRILGGMRRCRADIRAYAPDAVILVDYPGFNLSIAQWVKKKMPGVKVFYYISPKIWAWKEWRIRDIKRYVDVMLSILPFEVDFYHKHNYPITYVGNPTVDELAPLRTADFSRKAFCHRHDLNPDRPIIALIPGSRKAEVTDNLHVMLRAVAQMGADAQLLVAGAPGLDAAFYRQVLSGTQSRGIETASDVRVIFGETYDLMRAARAAAVTSGTATLEAAYLNLPQVVCYGFGGGMIFYRIMEWLLRNIRYVSLVNLLLGKEGVKELLGPYLTPDNLAHHLHAVYTDGAHRQQVLADYDEMRRILGAPGAPQRAAEKIVETLKN